MGDVLALVEGARRKARPVPHSGWTFYDYIFLGENAILIQFGSRGRILGDEFASFEFLSEIDPDDCILEAR